MALSFEKEFIFHCKKQNLEINSSQIDLLKKLQEYYEGNFQSLISKIFKRQYFKKGFYLCCKNDRRKKRELHSLSSDYGFCTDFNRLKNNESK